MVKYLKISLWVLSLLAAFVTIGNLYADDLSDSQKKEIVDQLYKQYQKNYPNGKDIEPAEVIRLIKQDKVVLIDVRTPDEMRISMLPGAITEVDYLKESDTYKGLTTVAYCTIGYRSGKFAKKMAAEGIEVKNLAGGLLAWVFDGGRVYRVGKEVKQIHVYGPKWDYPPSGYEAVMFSLLERLF